MIKVTAQIKKNQKSKEDFVNEQSEIEGILVNFGKDFEEYNKNYNSLYSNIETKELQLEDNTKKCDEINKQRKEMEDRISKLNKELNHKKEELHISSEKISKSKSAFDILNTEKEKLLHENSWIENEKEAIMNGKNEFNFQGKNVDEMTKVMEKLSDENKKLAVGLNFDLQYSYSNYESQYNKITMRRNILDNDYKCLIKSKNECDELRKKFINEGWSKIDENFNIIFKQILSNADAHFLPVSNQPESDGFKLTVSFDKIKSRPLSELSGGQKSLMGLSLIFSMLKYNPAPLYLLDEVDAALDNIYTSSIGGMIKTQFPNSQFIIVTHNQNMSVNANVAYQLLYANGRTEISRKQISEDEDKSKFVDSLIYTERIHKQKVKGY